MAKQEIMCGVDIGSTQISVIIGRFDPSKDVLEIISGARTYCRGVNGGVVVNICETANGIKRAIEEAEEKTDEVIHGVYLGIRGSHIETVNNRGVVSISRTDKEITNEDVTSVIENAKAIQISTDREIIDTVAQEFSVDRQMGVPDPTGMEGNYLEVYVHIVTASRTHLNNIYKAVAQAGFSVIDLGGQTTGIAVYSENSIRFSKELQMGSDLITRDISYALRTSIANAKEIKERYGVASPNMVDRNEEIEFTSVDGRTIRKTDVKFLSEIIAPRVEEIFEKINEAVQEANFSDVIVPGGIIITGGGSLLKGIVKASEQVLGVSSRLGICQGIKGPQEIVSNPSFATAIGLLKYRPSLESIQRSGFIRRMPFWRRFKDIFREIL